MTDINVTVTPPAQINVALSGTQGLTGPPGVNLLVFEQVALVDGAQTITLPSIPSGWCALCINGLRQSVSAYSVTGAVLTLPASLNVLTGDLISFDFTPTH